ncbi:MFS transporter [Bacillus sp. Marseille-P3661]|uniref:MFS transporter n=1 Tax=Bacillus sp. Marseille-P3661 TaxID=1936234 RepID=UPI000C82C718|nr:MFS transporter [Bacillus sp. Marseille-P3661]
MRLFIFMLCQTIFSIILHGSRPLVSLYSHSLGVNEAVIGLLVSGFAVMPMLFAIKIGKWLDVFGARKLTVIGGTGIGLAFIIPALYPHIYALFLSQLIMGISHLATLVSLQKTVGNYPGNRDKLMATFSLTGSFGELVGPLASGYLYEYYGFAFSYRVAFFLTIIAIMSAFLVKSEHWNTRKDESLQPPQNSGKESTWKLLKQVNLRKAVLISGLVLYSKDLFVAYFPVYASQNGMGASEIGILLSVMAAAAILVRIIQFKLVHTYGRGKVILYTLSLSGISFVLIPFFTNQIMLGFLVMLLGAGLGLGQPISLVYALNVSPAHRQGEVLGLRLTFNRGSQFIAPFIFGSIGTMAGISPVFWLSGLVLMVGAKYTRMRKEDSNIPQIKKEKTAE